MLASSTRRLVVILCGVLLVSAVAIVLDLCFESLGAARESIALHDGQIRRLQQSLPPMDRIVQERDALKKEVESRSSRFYSRGETDPYAFGAVVRRKLASLGITVLRYQVVEVKGASYLDFTVSGTARAFVLFLRDVSQASRVWTIPSLTLSLPEASGTVNVDFRIGYAAGDT